MGSGCVLACSRENPLGAFVAALRGALDPGQRSAAVGSPADATVVHHCHGKLRF
jgi:hypothetical protein